MIFLTFLLVCFTTANIFLMLHHLIYAPNISLRNIIIIGIFAIVGSKGAISTFLKHRKHYNKRREP